MDSRLLFSRAIFILVAIVLFLLAIRNRKQVRATVNQFFTVSTHPLNLAVFRIVIFATLIEFINVSRIVWFSQMPEELQFIPGNLGWLFNYLPINPDLTRITAILLLVFCFTGAIGLFSRTSAFIVAILGFYVLGIPQLWGKVNHYNHLLWFPAILAVSRCGDFFSVDALIAACKRADRGKTEPPAPAQIYTLPIRFIWLLMGVIYFFPGFWKFWRSGYSWAWSDNLNYQMYTKWLQLDGWTPFFRIDQYPLLSRFSGLWTIVWELAFIFLLFLPKWRLVAVLMGLFFHNMTNVFMRISFWTLQACYVVFFDWHRIFNRLGGWLFSQPMYVIYNGNCRFCRRAIASVRVFDILGRINYINALDRQTLEDFDLLWDESDVLTSNIDVVVDQKHWYGFRGYRVLCHRIPILWPLIPLMYLGPVAKIGSRLNLSVANSPTDNTIASPGSNQHRDFKLSRRIQSQAVIAVGILFLFCSIYYGAKFKTAAWPFSCYPTFSWIARPQVELLEVVPLDASGQTIPFSKAIIKDHLSSPRFDSLIRKLIRIKRPAERNTRLQAFWQLLTRHDSRLEQAALVQFYKTKFWVSPERQQENPVNRELFYQLKL